MVLRRGESLDDQGKERKKIKEKMYCNVLVASFLSNEWNMRDYVIKNKMKSLVKEEEEEEEAQR